MNDPEMERTIEFVKMFDRMFDCLNVSSLDAGKFKRNAFKAPYHSAKDFRLKVIYQFLTLLTVFLMFQFCSGLKKIFWDT